MIWRSSLLKGDGRNGGGKKEAFFQLATVQKSTAFFIVPTRLGLAWLGDVVRFNVSVCLQLSHRWERVFANALSRVIFTLCWSGSLTMMTQQPSIQSSSFLSTNPPRPLSQSQLAALWPNFTTFPRCYRTRYRKSRARVKGFALIGLPNLYCHKSLISATHM